VTKTTRRERRAAARKAGLATHMRGAARNKHGELPARLSITLPTIKALTLAEIEAKYGPEKETSNG
jgi:hypothetical protein